MRRSKLAVLPFSTIRLIPHLLIAAFLDREGLIRSDIVRWAEIDVLSRPAGLLGFLYRVAYYLTFRQEYRNVFYMRIGAKAALISWLCPPMASLVIGSRNIGPGLFIQHGIATLISADRIGANCWINQQVSIGYTNRTDRPTIGDNVKINAGAKLVGKVTVGDGATIGLNTVVIANVPAGATVFGVPGQVVWRKR